MFEGHHVVRFWSLVEKADVSKTGCWEWIGGRQIRAGKPSYGIFCVGKRRILAHRFVWMVEHGDIPDTKVIRHRCDNVACVRPDHLEVGTQADNMRDMWSRGRGVLRAFASGVAHHQAKMTPERVAELRRAQFGEFAKGYRLDAAKTKKDQVRLIGNSVVPACQRAVVAANLGGGMRRAA